MTFATSGQLHVGELQSAANAFKDDDAKMDVFAHAHNRTSDVRKSLMWASTALLCTTAPASAGSLRRCSRSSKLNQGFQER